MLNAENKNRPWLMYVTVFLLPVFAVSMSFHQWEDQVWAYLFALAVSIVALIFFIFSKKYKYLSLGMLALLSILWIFFFMIYSDHLTDKTCREYGGFVEYGGYHRGRNCFVQQSTYDEIMIRGGASYRFANIYVSGSHLNF